MEKTKKATVKASKQAVQGKKRCPKIVLGPVQVI